MLSGNSNYNMPHKSLAKRIFSRLNKSRKSKKFDGKMLSVDEDPMLLMGEWQDTRSVIIEFPCKKSALAWMTSDEYQAIAKHRDAGSTANSILVKGFG